jgi:hypothetical protein
VLTRIRESGAKRVAVVFGGAHAYLLRDRLARAGIEVLPTGRFFPLVPGELAAAADPADPLRALRLLNLQNWGALPPAALARLEALLGQVEAEPRYAWDARLFRGKLLLHRRQPDRALVAFQAAAQAERAVVSAYDGTTHVREAALVFAALAHRLAGRKDQARQGLQAVIDDAVTTPATREWARQLVATE